MYSLLFVFKVQCSVRSFVSLNKLGKGKKTVGESLYPGGGIYNSELITRVLISRGEKGWVYNRSIISFIFAVFSRTYSQSDVIANIC